VTAAAVAGAAGALGRAIARRLAEAGYTLVLLDRAGAALGEVAAALGPPHLAFAVDLRRPRDLDRALDRAERRLGPLRVWVGATGAMHDHSALDVPIPVWRAYLEDNLTAAFAGAQCAARRMRAGGGGAVVLLGSTAGDDPRSPAGVAYAAAKAAIPYVVRRLAYECAPFGVRVNAVVPGVVDTAMNDALPAPAVRDLVARIPLGRKARPEEVAEAVAFLVGEGGAYITGACLPVTGGRDL
jgi:NAD(P)-dependent dehydrogenase (short-subunit alcohol dehydrogenase family)